MSPSLPPRKFAPEPFETSSKSSKQDPPVEDEGKSKPRRFAPEPVETTTRSSQSSRQQSPEKGGPRRFAPEPVEMTERKSSGAYRQQQAAEMGELKPRKFAVQPVETTTKSSKDKKESSQEGGETPRPRRFAPQLMETSRKNSKDKFDEEPAKSKFSPQPVETTHRSNRKSQDTSTPPVPDVAVEDESQSVRKFAPDLIDTAKRTRKAAGTKPSAMNAKLKTEQGWELHAKEARKHLGRSQEEGSGVAGSGDGGVILTGHGGDGHMAAAQGIFRSDDLRAPTSPMANRRGSSNSMRSHSFRMPELDTIESSESEQDSAPSVSASPADGSPLTTSDSSFQEVYKHATRVRESVDENFSSYLLQLEAKRMEARLQEQALAAFPNSDFHEPVQHYVDEDKESDSMELDDRPTTWEGHDEFFERARRESTVNWEQLEMQKHAERMSQDRKAGAPLNREPTKKQSESPWWNDISAADPDRELKHMQQGARPPMLGKDLRFPRCPSPEPARFDVTQGSTKLRNQMCYLTEHVESSRQNSDDGGLWAGRSPQSAKSTEKGLWGGFCVEDAEAPHTPGGHLSVGTPQGPTGLLTPRVESSNPFETSFAVPGAMQTGPGIQTPPPPGAPAPNAGNLDSIINADRELDAVMERDYPDSFITQVFNYLSLGYPSLARRFDPELAKISRVPVSELREDDRMAKNAAKGYIRLGADFEGGGGEGFQEVDSVRWKALKMYIREWAKQEKDMVSIEAFGGFGTGARRGSWAL